MFFKTLLLLACCVTTAQAQTDKPTLPQAARSLSSLHPSLPKEFDRSTVEKMIADIDKPRQASVLKMAYFMRRKRQAFPVEDGWKLLQTAVQKETVASKRWFLLQDVRAFVGLRLKFVPHKEGFDAYDVIFDHAADAPKAHAEYYLSRAISELVNSIPLVFLRLQLGEEMRTPTTTIKAWTAFITAQNFPAPISRFTYPKAPDWIAALEAAGVPQKFPAVLEKQLSDKSIRRSYELLSVAAHVFKFDESKKPLPVFEEAQRLLPKVNAKDYDSKEDARFLDDYVEALMLAQQGDKSLSVAREWTQQNGTGWAKLVFLLKLREDETAVDTLVAELAQKPTSETEIFAVFDELAKWGQQSDLESGERRKTRQQITTLLENYLTAARVRTVAGELKARSRLASHYYATHQFTKIEAILDTRGIEAKTPTEKSLLQTFETQKLAYQKALSTP